MDVMLALYKSFILPHLEYCSPLLLGVGKVQANKIEDANHYILRTLTGHGKSLSYQELLNICKLDTESVGKSSNLWPYYLNALGI